MHRKRFWLFLAPTFLAFLLPGWIFAQAPTANFTADTLRGCSTFPLVVNFQDLSTGNPTSWFWDFGDPRQVSVSTLQNPSYIYSGSGCFDVTLIVTNANGSDTLVQSCFIELQPEPVPDFTVDVSQGCAPLTVQFMDASIINAPSNVEWFWSFSNGDFSTDQNPVITFPDAPATLDLRLTVTNSNGCQATRDFENVIEVFEAPVLDFTVDVNSACNPPLTVNITNTTVTNGANLNYTWQFPNGTPVSSNDPNPPPIQYNQVGSFDVTLIASGDNNCSDTLVRSGFIGVGGVTADFTASATEVCLGTPITFTNTSVGGVDNVEWLFGDGASSTDNNPVHTYSAPGLYSVELRANNPDGCGDTLLMQDFIQVNPIPEANFGVSGNSTCLLPATYTFTDSSTNAVSWLWDFGDGTTSTQQNPTHNYTSFGSYTVMLTVTNAQGCTDTASSTAPIEILQPEAAFGGDPTQGCVPMTVDFTDNSISSDSIVSWNWTITPSNGVTPDTVSTDQHPSFTFNETGSYHIRLEIETLSGCRDTVELLDYIQSGTPPMADFIVSRDTVCVNDTLNFTSLEFPDDSAWTYSWDFMYDSTAGFNELSALNDPPFAYPDTGLFAVALIVENNGCRDTMIKNQLVFVSPPRADFTLSSPLVCGLPGTVNVMDNSIGPITDYEWFIDGAPIGGNSPDPGPIPITTLGAHTVKLKVTYSLTGCTDSMELVVQAGDPVADFNTTDLRGCKPYLVNFNNTSLNAVAYRWDLDAVTTQLVSPPYTYQDTGFKDIQLIAIDAFGCTDTLLRPAYIEVLGPYVNFSASDSAGCPPLSVQFTDLTAIYRNSSITSWSWDFGDPASGASNTSSLQNPTHDYLQTGTYPITLTVTDSDGCTDTQTIPDFIQVTFPQPDFVVDDSMSCAGNPLNFTNLSQTPNTSATSYLWRFGDGETSTEANPIHAYADTGRYSVTLIVTDANGCVDSLTKTDYIYIEPFNADFVGDPLTSICPPLNASFFNLSQGTISGVNWDFGDGAPPSNILDDTVGHTYLVPGTYDVTLTVVHEDGCTDQLTRPDYVEIDGPVGTFEILPASTICLGEEIQIIVYSTKAVTITADYRDGNVEQMNAVGDSVVQDTTIFTHTYNNAGCFVPFILLQDFQGCPFAIDSAATVCVIAPPNAAIAQSDTIGCAPFDLGLADATVPGDTSLASWFWRFSDGDTSVVQNPVHTFQTPGLYTIDLLVTDSVGCVDSARTTFEAFSGAVADFVASDTLACSPIDIDFTDLSTGPAVLEWEWYFGDGPGLGDSIQHPTHTYLDDGRFTVTMVIRDVVGCTDTITKQDYIYLRHPEAALEASALLGCNPVDITFRSTGTLTDTTITNYQWCITDSASNLTQCVSSLAVDSIVMPFSEPGNFLVQLVVTDALGCPDSSEVISVSINQRVVPPPLSMRRVSVESDTSVSVFWEPYQLTDFMSYVVYRTDPNGLTVALDTLRDQLTTQYLDHDPALDCSQNVYCYQVLVQNTCEEFSLLSATPQHCTIELTASPDLDAIDLAWTPYIGFNVAAYQIFRVDSYDLGTASFIGSVSGSTLSFTDTATFCRDSITYRVMAINAADTSEVSYSDISASAPLHSEPVEPVDMLFATVVNDTFVSVEWEPYTGYKPDSYYVERSIDGSVWDSLGTFALNTTTFTDTAVAVDEQSYYYRVFAIDSCGDLTPAGMHGRSILLTTSLTVKDPLLNWNHYSQWPLGVLNYEIEIFNESTQSWELIEIVPGNVRSFTDNISRLNQSTYCYRVRATEAGGLSSQSLSNESCVTFAPLVFTPNAFTPNGDGHNDLFRVFVPNLRNAELLIFDRWGELLFRTLNLDDGWDGTYKGQHVQEGVYVFLINGQGEDGTAFTRSGTVTLIR